jgi:hypothetical protein
MPDTVSGAKRLDFTSKLSPQNRIVLAHTQTPITLLLRKTPNRSPSSRFYSSSSEEMDFGFEASLLLMAEAGARPADDGRQVRPDPV